MAWYNGDNGSAIISPAANKLDAFKASKAVAGGFGSSNKNVEDVEIKLVHRFKVKFGIFRAVGHHVKTITKPNVTFAEIEVPKLNTKVYFAGRKTQDQATVELDDSLDNAVTNAAQTQLQKQANFDTNYHAASAGAYFFNMTAEEVAGDGASLASWYYNKCVVMTCDFGTLDYSDDAGTSSINLGIRYANFTTWVNSVTFGKEQSDSKDGSDQQSQGDTI